MNIEGLELGQFQWKLGFHMAGMRASSCAAQPQILPHQPQIRDVEFDITIDD